MTGLAGRSREEHNQVRPHEALRMEVPAQRWRPSSRCFIAEPKPWSIEIRNRLGKCGKTAVSVCTATLTSSAARS
jgi:hypothetical protein